MKALLYRVTGGTDVLEYVDVEDPTPGPDDVIVHVAVTALNQLDIVQRAGYFTMPGNTLPHIAGMDVVGTIVEIGTSVPADRICERVVVNPSLAGVADGSKLAGMGDLRGDLGVIGATVAGGYAERCLVPQTHALEIPDAMSWDDAVCFPSSWVTAWHALIDVGQLQAGEAIMIHAAGSGLGVAAIQLAKHLGATVLATAGTDDKCEQARSLGADFVLNNRTGDVTAWAYASTGGVDVVFDFVGPALWDASFFALRHRGRLVCCGNTTGDAVSIPSLGFLYSKGIRILGSDAYTSAEFAAAWATYQAGQFRAVVDSVFALTDGAQAQDKMSRSDFFGKILLRP